MSVFFKWLIFRVIYTLSQDWSYFWMEIISNETTEANFTFPSSNFTFPRAKFTWNWTWVFFLSCSGDQFYSRGSPKGSFLKPWAWSATDTCAWEQRAESTCPRQSDLGFFLPWGSSYPAVATILQNEVAKRWYLITLSLECCLSATDTVFQPENFTWGPKWPLNTCTCFRGQFFRKEADR